MCLSAGKGKTSPYKGERLGLKTGLRFAANGLVISSSEKADVAELADALDSKSSSRK
jgi:hypothetical protein